MDRAIFDLRGKVAVVTGGAGVLCGQMARDLGKNGADVVVLDLRGDVAELVAAAVCKAGGRAIGIACDVLDRRSLEQAHDAVLAKFGGVHILINGAGGNSPKATTSQETMSADELSRTPDLRSFFDLDPEGVQFAFNLNFLGTLLPSQVFGETLAKGGGVIVNVSSMSAFRPLTKIPAYSAAKAAVSNFTQWLAVHMAPVGVRVNAMAPGFFLTDQNRFLLTDQQTGELTPRGHKIVSHTPMARFGNPEDLTGTLLWLVSDASAFVTGVVVPVDGGFSAYSGV